MDALRTHLEAEAQYLREPGGVKASLLNGFSGVDYSTKAQVRWLPEPVPTQDHWSPALLCFPGVQRHGARSRLLHASHGPAAQKAFAATWQGLTVT